MGLTSSLKESVAHSLHQQYCHLEPFIYVCVVFLKIKKKIKKNPEEKYKHTQMSDEVSLNKYKKIWLAYNLKKNILLNINSENSATPLLQLSFGLKTPHQHVT